MEGRLLWILPSAIYYPKDGAHKNNGVGDDQIPHTSHFRMSIEYMFHEADCLSRDLRPQIWHEADAVNDARACKYDLRGEQMMKFCPSIHSAFQFALIMMVNWTSMNY